MKKSIKNKWVKALRSGEYLQCKGALTKQDADCNDTFCCLGVLTNLYVEEVGVSKLHKGYWTLNEEGAALLSKPVMKWSGVSLDSGRIFKKPSLAYQNDSGKTFNEIADIIDKNWERL